MENPDFLTTPFEKANCLEISRGLKNRGPDPCNGGLSGSLFSFWPSKAKDIKLPFKYHGDGVILKKTETFSEVFLFRV